MTDDHTIRAHAKLAPSSAFRWMQCPGSIRMSAGIAEVPSVFAAEGTAAHILAERCLNTGDDAAEYRGWFVNVGETKPLNKIALGKQSFKIDAEMADAVQLYLDVAREIIAEADEWEIEHRMDMSNVVGGVFGTGDLVAYSEQKRRITIADYKHGKGVAVEVEDNEQELTYAMGVLQRYHNRGVEEVELVIAQPRAPHRDGPIRRWVTDTLTLYEHVIALQAAANAVEAADAPLVAGDHCKFCKAAAVCPALRDKALTIIGARMLGQEITEMSDPTKLTLRDWKIEAAEIEMVKNWCRRREEFAHAEAIQGRLPPGAKLVAKRAVRKWADPDTAVEALRLAGLDDDALFETELRSPAQVEKELPKGERAIVNTLSVKQSGGTVLAPLDDPRDAVTPQDAIGFDAVEIQGRE